MWAARETAGCTGAVEALPSAGVGATIRWTVSVGLGKSGGSSGNRSVARTASTALSSNALLPLDPSILTSAIRPSRSILNMTVVGLDTPLAGRQLDRIRSTIIVTYSGQQNCWAPA